MWAELLAVGAALSWGVSDFVGGVTSRRLPLMWVLFFTQLVGFAVIVPFALARGAPPFDTTAVLAAVLGSLSGLIGIAGLYRAIALGVGSIAAPISATGAALPVVFGLARGEPTSTLQEIGMVCALAGVIAASRTGDEQAHLGGNARLGIACAVVAAFGFGGFFILLHEASTQDVLWAVSIQRATGSVVMAALLLARRPPLVMRRRDVPAVLLVGCLDQVANVLYAFASTVGLVSLSAVLASLYPMVTVILARVVLDERISRLQKSGVALALTGVALVAGH
ncbi:MAG TPA: EamA family transporter [Chloroflexota bacterium]|jgi:drug/metabolite transporter (DMT)-like permease